MSAAHGALHQEATQQVQTAVRELPPRYREVVVLRYLEDLPVDEIAQILGLARNAVEVRLTRARQQLQRRLGALVEG